MKKQLLTLAFSMLLCAGIAAADTLEKVQSAPKASAPAREATADGCQINFCGDIDSWATIQQANNTTHKFYIYITPDIATQLAGNQLTSLTFSFASGNAATQKIGRIFVTENINGASVTEKSVTIKPNNQDGTLTQTHEFNTPYIIKEGVGFYMGYEVKQCTYSPLASKCDLPISYTALTPNEFCGQIVVTSATGAVLINKPASDYGIQLFLQGNTVGDKQGIENLFSVGEITFGDFTLPVVDDVNNAYAPISITNLGSNTLTTLDYSVTCGGNTVSGTAEIDVPGNNVSTVVGIPMTNLTEGEGTASVSVTAINGVEISRSATFNYIGAINGGYDRKWVVEEGTGTWCGWCPRGIVGFETMEAEHPEKFIGIAVHSGDNMAASSYSALISKFFPGFPDCVVNRDPKYVVDPNPGDLAESYNIWESQKAVAKVDAEVYVLADKKLKVKTNTEFGFSTTNGKYRLAYVVLEDGIVGQQTNNYAGGSSGPMGGWESYGSSKSWVYKHVARKIYTVWGVTNSIPATINACEANEYEYSFSISNVKTLENSSVVVLILDSNTGTILNATKIKAADFKDITAEGVTLNETEISLTEGESVTLTATVLPSDVTDKTVVWSSSDNEVATVTNGKVTAVKAGTATITAKCGNVAAECQVTVTAGAGITSVSADNNAPVEYYNLQGVRVSGNLPAGIYIKRQGTKTYKVEIR